MKKLIIPIVLAIFFGFSIDEVSAQQDAQYTQYMYNTLSINPAYAGSREVFSFVGLYRTQWVGLDGAPDTGTVSLHTPVGKNVGLGLNITHDEIFITQETYIDIPFSYSFNVSETGKLSLGLKAGAHLLNVNFDEANPFQNGDTQATEQDNIDNKFSPQFGAGVFYYTDKFYAGLSAPNILRTEHFDESEFATSNSVSTAKEKINYYIITGYAFDVNTDLKFKPALLLKAVDGAPLALDVSANLLIKEKVTLGLAYRWSAALSAMAGFQVSDGLMIGLGYDRETTEIQQYNDGSYEIFLRYEIFKNRERLVSPRFF